jgi:hypothetical protein
VWASQPSVLSHCWTRVSGDLDIAVDRVLSSSTYAVVDRPDSTDKVDMWSGHRKHSSGFVGCFVGGWTEVAEAGMPVLVENSVTGSGLDFHPAGRYSLSSPPRHCRRRIVWIRAGNGIVFGSSSGAATMTFRAGHHLRHHQVQVEQGPVVRWGGRGRGTSIYFGDPDGSLLELIIYGWQAGDRHASCHARSARSRMC